jgi:hypothetical protein
LGIDASAKYIESFKGDKMKAWVVTDDDKGELIYAETRAEARLIGSRYLGYNEPQDVSIRHVAEGRQYAKGNEAYIENDRKILRQCGFHQDEEDECDSCGKASMDMPEYKVCSVCNQCKDCGCADDCEGE